MHPWDTVNPITRIAAEQERLADAEAHLQLSLSDPERVLWVRIAQHAAGEIARWEQMMAELRAQS